MPRKDYVPNLFESPGIQDVTAIVGKNGAGKSSILDLIKDYFPSGQGGIEFHGIIVVQTNNSANEDIEVFFSSSFGKLQVNNKSDLHIGALSSYMVQELVAKTIYGKVMKNSKLDAFEQTTFIYYSNTVDLKREPANYQGLVNISTNSMLCPSPIDPHPNHSNALDRFDKFRQDEMINCIRFSISPKGKNLPFKTPTTIEVKVLQNDIQYLIDEIDQHSNLKSFRKLIELLKGVWGAKVKSEMDLLIFAGFTNFLRTHLQSSSILLPFNNFEKMTPDNFSTVALVWLKQIGSRFNGYTSNKAKALLSFLSTMKRIRKTHNSLMSSFKGTMQFRINKESRSEIVRVVESYYRAKGVTDFLSLEWRNLTFWRTINALTICQVL